MEKQNCWEFTKCGREPNGFRSAEMGVCPASTLTAADGFCGGKNGGRACVYITGTFCNGEFQWSFDDKKKNCLKCTFYETIKKEHGPEMTILNFNSYLIKNRSRDK